MSGGRTISATPASEYVFISKLSSAIAHTLAWPPFRVSETAWPFVGAVEAIRRQVDQLPQAQRANTVGFAALTTNLTTTMTTAARPTTRRTAHPGSCSAWSLGSPGPGSVGVRGSSPLSSTHISTGHSDKSQGHRVHVKIAVSQDWALGPTRMRVREPQGLCVRFVGGAC